ncbi:hypothetical protein H0H92_006461 [Tricholoma furcatifolium]|nr:hypothetical protein H0H92_006461 [Tricholoma furcatifolium]
MYQGADFLNDWDFFTSADPTHGTVNYQSQSNAVAKGLAFVQDDGTTVLAVDNTTVLTPNAPRNSVRITTKKTYNQGLFIADFSAMPHGCSVWPSYWSVGPNWPESGEIDVVEGVHNQETNLYTLHTSSNCSLATASEQLLATSEVRSTECASSGKSNNGCGFTDTDTRSYGHGFNIIDGGVFAHLWTDEGISVWHFARGEIPGDITSKTPDPSTWGDPAAFWSSSACDIASHFHDHSLVLDTTLCGDFGNPTYAASGCPGTCAQAVADPTNFDSVYN